MTTARYFLLTAILLLTSCVITPDQREKNPDGSTAAVMLFPQAAAPVYIAAALLDQSGRVLNKISGHVYCGDGVKQRPANRARIELWEKTKILTTITTDMDGSYSLNYKPGFKEDFHFMISSSCGQLKDVLRKEVVKNYDTVDFWIK